MPEPYGVQVIKRLHADTAGLLHEYDEMLENTNDPEVKQLLTNAIISQKNLNTQIRHLFFNHRRFKSMDPGDGMWPLSPEETREYLGDDSGVEFDLNGIGDDDDEGEMEELKQQYHKRVKALRRKYKHAPGSPFSERGRDLNRATDPLNELDDNRDDYLLDDTGFEPPHGDGNLPEQSPADEAGLTADPLEGLDEPEPGEMGPRDMAEEHFHKAMRSAADFLRKLGSSNNAVEAMYSAADDSNVPHKASPSCYHPGDKVQQFGKKSAKKSDDPFDQDDGDDNPADRFNDTDKRSFSSDSQRESSRHADNLDQYTSKVVDPEVLDQLMEAINTLRGLSDSRRPHGSEEELRPSEKDSIDRSEKALRSILDRKRRKFPKRNTSAGSPPNRGKKGISIDALCRDAHKQTKDLQAIERTLKDLMETL
jgi:hypothetical protein